MGIPEEEEREGGTEGILEQIIVENFPNLGKETGIKIQEAQQTPSTLIKIGSTPTYNSEAYKTQRQR